MTGVLDIDWSTKARRADFIKSLVVEFGYKSYLEIGCRENKTFDAIVCQRKVGVDPERGGTVRATSDEFFASNTEKFDIVFVDGDHRCEQVYRDVVNSLAMLNDGGCIVMHDCIPLEEKHQRRQYTGGICNQDAWKACVLLRTRLDIDVAVGKFDCGVGVVIPRLNSSVLEIEADLNESNMVDMLDWELYISRWQQLLRVMEIDALRSWIRDPSSVQE